MTTVKFVVFLLLSALLLTFTLRRRHRHRFYRLMAFESLLGLVLLNAEMWFQDAFSDFQILSWSLLAGSLVLALHSVRILYREGNPEGDLDAFVTNYDGAANDFIWINSGGAARLAVSDTSPGSFIPDSTEDDVLQIIFSHNGLAGDRDLELNRWDLDFFRADAAPHSPVLRLTHS